MKSLSLTLILITCTLVSYSQTPTLNISTKNNSEYEIKMGDRLERLAKTYDLSKWTFTQEILIEDYAIPHSHPVLTLNTRKQNDDSILSTYIHEQTHWFMVEHNEDVNLAIEELKKKYPEVPVGKGEGAKDTYSSYLHLLVCYLEYEGLIELVGKERATLVIEEMNHYKWIYQQVLDENEYLTEVIDKYNLRVD